MTEVSGPKSWAVANEFDVIHALRARADALNVSRTEIDRVAGLTPGHAAKLLALPPLRCLGPLTASTTASFWRLVASLGLSVALVEDPAAMHRFADRMDPRQRQSVRYGAMRNSRIPWLITSENARELGAKGAAARNASLSPSTKRKIAKIAARIRWSQPSKPSQGGQS